MALSKALRGRSRKTRDARNTPTTSAGATTRRAGARARLPCPTCGEADGFLLEMEGAVYRVLEDAADTELLQDAAAEETFVTCAACKTVTTAALVLTHRPVSRPSAEAAIRMGPRRNRVHTAGNAGRRTTADGRELPMCPECGATHDFFVDLEGAAYRVLEDDDDTDLLGEATNLLCSRCHAVFEL